MSETRLPTYYHGDQTTETIDETALIDTAIQKFAEQFNAIPPGLKGAFMASALMTACMAHPRPQAALEEVVGQVTNAMRLSLAKPEGEG